MFYDNKVLSKMKVPQLEEIIALFKQAGVETPETFANSGERIAFIEKHTLEKGYPHVATIEMVEQAKDGEMKVGDVVFLPAPTEEDTLRENTLVAAETIIAGLDVDDDEKAKMYADLQELETTALVDAVDALEKKVLEASQNGSGGDNNDGSGEQSNTTTNDAPVVESEATKPVRTGDDIQDAINTGKFKFENQIIVGYQVKIFAGQTRYDLYAVDRCTYGASKEQVDAIVKDILNLK